MSKNIGHQFLLQSLNLFASYLFGQSVELEATALGITTEEGEDETGQFLRELEARHALACAIQLKDILSLVERRTSNSSTLVRSESKGAIRGRIDIPHYIARRVEQKTLPRTYPILINEESPDTPENALVVQVLKGLSNQLGKSPFPRACAEGKASLFYYGWGRSRLFRLPWASVTRFSSIDRLKRETLQRVRKRQTGNDLAYNTLLRWCDEWQMDISQLGNESKEKIADGILAFPIEDFFWEKVFEVWCIQEIADCLVRCGCKLVEGPKPLHRRKKGAIFRFEYQNAEIQLWYQRQYPMGTPHWLYSHSGNPLKGIPDIVLTLDGKTPLTIDAKFRWTKTDTRSEEIYKLLGYAENFRISATEKPFHGLLIFIGEKTTETTLTGPYNGRVAMVVIDEFLREKEAGKYFLDRAIREWLF